MESRFSGLRDLTGGTRFIETVSANPMSWTRFPSTVYVHLIFIARLQLTAFAFRDYVRFGYVDQGDTRTTRLLRQFNVNTYAPTMLLFKEDTEKPADIIQVHAALALILNFQVCSVLPPESIKDEIPSSCGASLNHSYSLIDLSSG